jgi:hypothetical protein
MGALMILDISNQVDRWGQGGIGGEGAKHLAGALKDHAALTSLNLASNYLCGIDKYGDGVYDASGVTALANAIPGMGALSVLNLAANNLVSTSSWMQPPRKGLKVGDLVDGDPVAEIHSAGQIKITYISGIIAIADAMPDMGALSLVNVMGNRIGKEMLSKLEDIMHSKPNLVSLCGIADDATEADLSGLNMDADDAIILASELPDKRALLFLDISSNELWENWSFSSGQWWLNGNRPPGYPNGG